MQGYRLVVDTTLLARLHARDSDIRAYDPKRKQKSYTQPLRTKQRSITITANTANKIIKVHNGYGFKRVILKDTMIGFKFGEFVFTKKLGRSIHDSKRNAKRKAKMRRKITQKKIRRAPTKSSKGPAKAKASKKK